MLSSYLVLTATLLIESFKFVHTAGCALNVTRLDAPMLVSSATESEFLYPEDGENEIEFSAGASLKLVCPGQDVDVGTSSYSDVAHATCISGANIKINSKSVHFDQVRCSAAAQRLAKLSGEACENNGVEVLIGFEEEDNFLTVFSVCFNEETQQAFYSLVHIPASINQRVKSVPRPSWLQSTDIFSIKSPDSYYARASQRENINALVGLSQNSTKYVQDNTNYYLSRGHMTAMTDNFYPAQQNVTFFLLNVAPQWQTCNGGNWETVESNVRDYAETNNVNLTQYTGVYGAATLPHEQTGEDVDLFLYNDNDLQAFPVPAFYWKVVYEPISQLGVALMVINNPYLDEYEPVCADIAEQIDWVKWSREDQVKGFGYACTVDTFRKVVDFLPTFTVKGLLL